MLYRFSQQLAPTLLFFNSSFGLLGHQSIYTSIGPASYLYRYSSRYRMPRAYMKCGLWASCYFCYFLFNEYFKTIDLYDRISLFHGFFSSPELCSGWAFVIPWMSVVRRPSSVVRRSSSFVNNFNNLLLWNHWPDLNDIWQE